ncbi:MAG: trigger factor [Candidatus Dormibacterales bacterium]
MPDRTKSSSAPAGVAKSSPPADEKSPSLAIEVERLPKSQVGMTIEVPAATVDATYERVLNRLTSRAKIGGFRPGRAPKALVEARLGPGVLREEVVEVLVPDAVQRALAEKDIDPIDNPDVEVLELDRGRPAKLKATISVMPEVKLGDASAIKIAARKVEVTDAMVERRLEDVRLPMAEITPVEREVRTGDMAVIDVRVEVDGEVVESETRQAMEADVKEGVLLPELLAALPGAFAGEDREATVKFPDDYEEPKLAGREATIKVKVQGVKEKILPALDDELARTLSQGAQETVEAYRSAVRSQLEESAAAMTKLEHEQDIVHELVESSSVEVPEALIHRELASQLESMERTLNRQGLKLERYLEYMGKTIDQWMAGETPSAESRLKVDLVLAEYARQQSLDPSEEDVLKFLEEEASGDDELKDQIEELKKSPSARRYFASRLRRQRVLERLVAVVGAGS